MKYQVFTRLTCCPYESQWTQADEVVDFVHTCASVLTGVWGALINLYQNTEKNDKYDMWLLLDVHTRMKTLGNPKVQGVEEKVMIWPKQNVGRTLLYVNYIQMWPGEILSLRLSPWLAGWNSAFTSWVSLSWQGRTQRMSTGCEEWKDFIIHLPIWHLRPVKPAKHEQVKEGFPVMQSSMQRPPFWQGLKLAQTKAEEDNRKESEHTDIFLFVL